MEHFCFHLVTSSRFKQAQVQIIYRAQAKLGLIYKALTRLGLGKIRLVASKGLTGQIELVFFKIIARAQLDYRSSFSSSCGVRLMSLFWSTSASASASASASTLTSFSTLILGVDDWIEFGEIDSLDTLVSLLLDDTGIGIGIGMGIGIGIKYGRWTMVMGGGTPKSGGVAPKIGGGGGGGGCGTGPPTTVFFG